MDGGGGIDHRRHQQQATTNSEIVGLTSDASPKRISLNSAHVIRLASPFASDWCGGERRERQGTEAVVSHASPRSPKDPAHARIEMRQAIKKLSLYAAAMLEQSGPVRLRMSYRGSSSSSRRSKTMNEGHISSASW